MHGMSIFTPNAKMGVRQLLTNLPTKRTGKPGEKAVIVHPAIITREATMRACLLPFIVL